MSKLKQLILPLTTLLIGAFGLTAWHFFTRSSGNGDSVTLISWQSEECDKGYNPYHAIARISNLKLSGSNTIMKISFPDNCCAEFHPEIDFRNNQLFIEPYKLDTGSCDCNCNFSLALTIKGLTGKAYQVNFKGKSIIRSDDPYPIVPIKQETYKDQIINRSNKYGFPEGIWIKFFPDGQPSEISKYPEQVIHPGEDAIFKKEFYATGVLAYFHRKDTLETWFKDGQLSRRYLKFVKGDTIFEYNLENHENGKLKSESLEKQVKHVFTSDWDRSYQAEGTRWQMVFKNSFFENGKREYLFATDTSRTWFENGKIKQKDYKDGSTSFGEIGKVSQRILNWTSKGPEGHGDLNHTLILEFHKNGSVATAEYIRDEEMDNAGIEMGVRYYWEWDSGRHLIKSPQNWNEELPWKRFSLLVP